MNVSFLTVLTTHHYEILFLCLNHHWVKINWHVLKGAQGQERKDKHDLLVRTIAREATEPRLMSFRLIKLLNFRKIMLKILESPTNLCPKILHLCGRLSCYIIMNEMLVSPRNAFYIYRIILQMKKARLLYHHRYKQVAAPCFDWHYQLINNKQKGV